jgi:hypothetical protein
MTPPYPWTYDEQLEWYKLFEQTMMEFINDIYVDYNLYISLRTREQLHKSYYSILETFESLNKYLSYVQQYIKWIEQMYPRITHKKIVNVVKQIYTNVQPRLENAYAIYWKLYAYMQIIIPPVMPVTMPMPLPAELQYVKN